MLLSVVQEAGLREGDYIVAVDGQDCKWAKHGEVVHMLKSCSDRGVELRVVTLHSHDTQVGVCAKACVFRASGCCGPAHLWLSVCRWRDEPSWCPTAAIKRTRGSAC